MYNILSESKLDLLIRKTFKLKVDAAAFMYIINLSSLYDNFCIHYLSFVKNTSFKLNFDWKVVCKIM